MRHDATYPVLDIVYPHFGDGCLGGIPTVLVELGGSSQLGPHDIAERALEAMDKAAPLPGDGEIRDYANGGWCTVRAGSTAEYEFTPLVAALQVAGYYVALEAPPDGTGHVAAGFDWVRVEPRETGEVLADAVAVADELAFTIASQSDVQSIAPFIARYPAKETRNVTVRPATPKALGVCYLGSLVHGYRIAVAPVENEQKRNGRGSR